MIGTFRTLLLVVMALTAVLGCARSPEAKKARHLDRGDKYYAKEQYDSAVIEYSNVLRLDMKHSHAAQRLALSHFHLGQLAQSFPWLLESKQLNPNSVEIRLKLGAIYLLGRKPGDARQEASWVLEREPKNLEALLLWAGTATDEQQVDESIRRLQQAKADFGDKAKLHLAIGALLITKKDIGGAEEAFREAVAREPKSAEAHLALAEYFTARRNTVAAEQEYRAAAELEPVGSPARVKLADFFLTLNKQDEAKRILKEVTDKAPTFLLAWRRLAEIAFVEQKFDDALAALDVILKKSGSDPDTRLLRGRVLMAKGQVAEATQEFQRALKTEPRFAPARFQLALAHLRLGNVQQAKTELTETIALSPNFHEATILLAELHLQAGAVGPAIEILEKVVTTQPNDIRVYALLGSAYLSKREPAKATEVFRQIVERSKNKDPRGYHLVGMGLLAQGKRAEAKKAFETALEILPEYLDPLDYLVSMAFADKQPDVALARVRQQMTRAPKSAPFAYLLAKVHERREEAGPAEAAYLKAVELDPNMAPAYVALGRIYSNADRFDDALKNAQEALKRNPQQVSAQLLIGVIYERKGDVKNAIAAYEKTLELSPRLAWAANNLAFLYSEHGGDKEKALQLAQLAKEASPDEPAISDTLGWILYKRGVYQRAVSLLKESAAKLPDNPEVQYHLGMAYAKVGDKANAKVALAKATASPASFTGKDEAKKTLREL
jgi:tetratricopeptide (TPR) repeat protein